VTKTMAFRAAVRAVLVPICSSVYYDHAESDAPYPRIVYSAEELSKLDGRTKVSLEINVLDYGTDTAACEILADAVQASLDGYIFIDDSIEFASWADKRMPIQEDDKKIIRRRLLFAVDLYERSNNT
jgi:hypothetical protein